MPTVKRTIFIGSALVFAVLSISAIVLVVLFVCWAGNPLEFLELSSALLEMELRNNEGDQPSAELMLENFHENREIFNTINNMLNEDGKLEVIQFLVARPSFLRWFGFGKVIPEFAFEGSNEVFELYIVPDDYEEIGIDKERIEEYRDVMRSIGCREISRFSDDKSYDLIFYRNTFFRGGTVRGYFYSYSPPKIVSDNIDTYRHKDNGWYEVHQHIEGNWYIFHYWS